MSCENKNEVILFEQERPPIGPTGCLQLGNNNDGIAADQTCTVTFVTNHVIDGPVPLSDMSNNSG